MLVESLVKATIELQGFRVVSVTGGTAGLVAAIAPDRRYSPRCGRCLEPAAYRDTRRKGAGRGSSLMTPSPGCYQLAEGTLERDLT